jgi:TolA-binding protein
LYKNYPNGKLAADAAFMEAECLRQQGRFDEALTAYERLPRSLGPGSQSLAYLHAGQAAAALKRWDESVRWLDACIRQFPDEPIAPEALCELGAVRQNQGMAKDAAVLYERAIATAGKVGRADGEAAARAQFQIGRLQFDARQYAEAAKSFLKVAYGYSFPKWQANAAFEAARAYESLGDKVRAAATYRELSERFPASDKVPEAKRRMEEIERTAPNPR